MARVLQQGTPHSSLGNLSPQMYRDTSPSLGGDFLALFFRSGAVHGATRRALAPLGPQHLR